LALLVAQTTAVGCRRPRERAYTKEQERLIGDAILASAPQLANPLNVDFREGVRLIGVELDRPAVRRGESVEVTWVWEALADIDEGGWKIFVHLEGPGRRATHDHHPVGDLYPINRWKRGQIVRYTQTVPIMADFPEGKARLWVGIFDEAAWADREENRRMQIANGDSVKATIDGEQRILVTEIDVSDKAESRPSKPGRRAEPARRSYTIYRTPTPPVLDGVLDEPLWQATPSTGPFVGPDGQNHPPTRATEARMAWDDTHLYVAFTVLDDRIENTRTGRDAELWRADVVEIYLDPTGRGENYYELQVSPTGEIFDALFRSRRSPEWPEAAANLTIAGLRTGIRIDGTVNDTGGQQDSRWVVEVAIPFSELPTVGAAPGAASEWGFNLYRIDQSLMAAWAPAGGDFHNTSAFGRVRFERAPPPSMAPVAPTPAPTPTPAPNEPATPVPAAPAPGEASPAPATPPAPGGQP
jgi:hypothetical protein